MAEQPLFGSLYSCVREFISSNRKFHRIAEPRKPQSGFPETFEIFPVGSLKLKNGTEIVRFEVHIHNFKIIVSGFGHQNSDYVFSKTFSNPEELVDFLDSVSVGKGEIEELIKSNLNGEQMLDLFKIIRDGIVYNEGFHRLGKIPYGYGFDIKPFHKLIVGGEVVVKISILLDRSGKTISVLLYSLLDHGQCEVVLGELTRTFENPEEVIDYLNKISK
jgi:hypothetical protein